MFPTGNNVRVLVSIRGFCKHPRRSEQAGRDQRRLRIVRIMRAEVVVASRKLLPAKEAGRTFYRARICIGHGSDIWPLGRLLSQQWRAKKGSLIRLVHAEKRVGQRHPRRQRLFASRIRWRTPNASPPRPLRASVGIRRRYRRAQARSASLQRGGRPT